METTTVNVPLLRKLVEWAEEQHALAEQGKPSRWNQGTWWKRRRFTPSQLRAQEDRFDPLCGTVMCLAGQTALITGYKVVEYEWYGGGGVAFYSADKVIGPDGVNHDESIEEVAVRELGLTYEQGKRLFDGDNDIERVRELATEIAGEEI